MQRSNAAACNIHKPSTSGQYLSTFRVISVSAVVFVTILPVTSLLQIYRRRIAAETEATSEENDFLKM